MTVRSFGVSALALAMGVVLSTGAAGQQLGGGGAALSPGAPPALKAAPSGGLGNGGAGLGNGAPKEEPGAEKSEASAAAGKEEASEATESSENQGPDAGEEAEKTAGKKAMAKAAATAADEPAVPTDELTGNLNKISLPETSGNSGGLNYSVPIEVPGFRGLEPRIGLSYNSSRKTKLSADYQGWLGYAWGVNGFDVIERASPRGGLPVFDGTDVFLLNGMDLVACAQATAGTPSCSTGGTHVTENESYRRIRFNPGTNEWAVTERDGTVSTFTALDAIAGTNAAAGTSQYDLGHSARWLLTSVADTHGNTVSYNYNCSQFAADPLTGVCYPSTVSYAGGQVDFYLEARPDQILMANGRDISVTAWRIKTIRILSGGQLMAAYSLTYDQAPFSNASRLTKVTQHGTDSTVATNGTVSGGASKLVAQMAYQDTNATYKTSTFSKNTALQPDRNFDGKDELFGITSKIASHYVFNADGSITEEGSSDNAGNADNYHYRQYYFGRFHPDRNVVDSVGTRVYRRLIDINGWYSYSVERNFAQTGVGLGAGPEISCKNATGASAPYASSCSELPDTGWSDYKLKDDYYRQRIVIDEDGDGVDRLLEANYRFESMLLGLGDFGGAGREQPLFVVNGKIAIAKIAGNDVVDDKILPSIGCGFSRFSSVEQNCQVADINGKRCSQATALISGAWM